MGKDVDVDIIGVGMHPFGRYPDKSLKELARTAIVAAVNDAKIGVKDIEAAYSANSLAGLLTGQEQIRGQTVLREVGIEGIPIVNVENACAGGSTALREAVLAIRAGVADVVLAVGFEKMFVADRSASLHALRSAADLDVVSGLGIQFPAIYAMRLRERIDQGVIDHSDLVLAAIKSHECGSRNPYAQFQSKVTAEEVENSKMIADPLRLLMCSAISDGAAAVIVARNGWISEGDSPRVAVKASALRSGQTLSAGEEESLARLCAEQAYSEWGNGPSDLDVLEVHDAMAPGEMLYYEHLGLCGPGEGARLLREGTTSMGGRHVVNPSGGLSSRGHPVGASGLAQVAELVWQLRGEAGDRQVSGARAALAQNSGGWLEGDSAACNVHIFERVSN